MRLILSLALAASLSACADAPRLDWCKHAELRRTAYSTTIATADAWVASGRPIPSEILLARQAAAAARALLDRNCPAPASPSAT